MEDDGQGGSHTPGPWRVALSKTSVTIFPVVALPKGARIASTIAWQGSPYRAVAEANAHLIAAAPELLEALEGLIGFAEAAETKMLVGDEGCLWPVEVARAAIARAKTQPLPPSDVVEN